MRKLSEDVTEMLEVVPRIWKVIRHVREKFTCQACEAITQPPAPAHPIARGRAGLALLAHVLVSKYGLHLPLNQQSAAYACEGIDLDVSTLADWVGAASAMLMPLVEALRVHVFAAAHIHADDIRRCRCWRRARRAPDACGPMCATIARSADTTRRPRCSSSRATAPAITHHATERMLRESGLAWTDLRDGFYASSTVAMLRDGIEAGLLAFPEDGKASWTAYADLAEAAAAILVQPGRFEGPAPPLTAEEALDLDDIAAIAANVTGHPERRERISDTDMEARLTGGGLPGPVVQISLGLFRASRAGEFETVDPALAALIGRPTTRPSQVLADEFKVK